MITKDQKTMLEEFFSAFFYEDWQEDADSVEEVIAEFRESVTLEERLELAAAIKQFTESYKDAEELERELFLDLGCCYIPTADNITPHEWLNKIIQLIVS